VGQAKIVISEKMQIWKGHGCRRRWPLMQHVL